MIENNLEEVIRKKAKQPEYSNSLEWNTFIDSNGKITICNIFDHVNFTNDIIDICKNKIYKDDFKGFAEQVRLALLYYFWGKYEYESIITTFPSYVGGKEIDRLSEAKETALNEGRKFYRESVNLETEVKIDVYDQVIMNFDKFINYLWDNKDKIKKNKKIK